MLGGCLALTNSLSWTSIPLPRLLILIATLNVYEAALIGLAMFLVLHRGLNRDGILLLILESFFLADVTFLNAEIATARLGLGIAIDSLLFVLAAIKLTFALRVLGMRTSPAHFAFILLQLAAILAIPLIFPRIDFATVPPIWFYAAWWLAAGLLASYELLCRLLPATPASEFRWPAATLVFLSIPWLSLVAHLGILHYVYQADYFAADAAPMFLIVALILNRVAPKTEKRRADILGLRIALPAAAMFVSANYPAQLCVPLGHDGHLILTPLRFATTGAYLIYVYSFLRGNWMQFLTLGFAGEIATLVGPSPAQFSAGAQTTGNWLQQFFWNLVPKTLTEWGAMAVTASFAFLGLGAMASLRRKNDAPISAGNEIPLDPPILEVDPKP
jgi:hypothetical protein